MTDDPQFYVLEVSLNNILMVELFSSNNRMVIFSKTEKKPYYFFFKQKNYCSFLQMEGVGDHTVGHIIGLNILKLEPIQLLEAVVSS